MNPAAVFLLKDKQNLRALVSTFCPTITANRSTLCSLLDCRIFPATVGTRNVRAEAEYPTLAVKRNEGSAYSHV